MANSEETKNFGAFIDRTMKVIKNQYLKGFKEIGVDITTEQWVLIDLLFHNKGISQNDLANETFKNAPTVSRIIDLLCKKGMTERKKFENDKRRHQIFLTKKGENTYKKALPKVEELRRQGWLNLTDQDYQDFLRIMNQVFINFEEEK